MVQLAKDAGLAHESLYRALSDGEKPRFDTHASHKVLGLKLTVSSV